MDEGFDSGGFDTADSFDVDVTSTDFEAIEDISVEDYAEPLMAEQELTELQNEADALELQPLDEGVDELPDYENIGDVDFTPFEDDGATEFEYDPSALAGIVTAGAEGLQSPSDLAQVGGAIFAPPGAEDAVAQGLQAGWNSALIGSETLMESVNDTYGNPAGEYQDILIQQAIEDGVESSGRIEPLEETFTDNEDVYDGEIGVCLTDESLREGLVAKARDTASEYVDVAKADDIQALISDINPNYDPFDMTSVYNSNCGSCALAVDQRLDGDMSSVASAENIGTIEEMNTLTGKAQVPMSPSEIQEYLIAQGAGSHGIVGIDRSEGPGHWFNAYYDGKRVVAVDGQTGEVCDWPPDYGDVTNWDFSVERKEG